MSTEKIKLMALLKENKISADEFHLLSNALARQSSPIKSIFPLLINPFQKIAGLYSLVAGFLIIISMSMIGSFAKVYFDGALAFNIASTFAHVKFLPNFYLLLYQNLLSWLILSGLFVLSAKLFQQKRIRFVDFLGTIAFARYPFLILTIFTLLLQFIHPGLLASDASLFVQSYNIVWLFCYAWQISTYFYALKESSGLAGKNLWISFVTSIVLADMTTEYFSRLVFAERFNLGSGLNRIFFAETGQVRPDPRLTFLFFD
jgi:hypothetical protein